MDKNIKNKNHSLRGKLVSDLSHLAHSYMSSYRPSDNDLKKHRVLRDLRKHKNIVILKPDKGNGVVVMDRKDYDQGIYKIIQDENKFELLSEDPTLKREGSLQRLLRKLYKKDHLDKETYARI